MIKQYIRNFITTTISDSPACCISHEWSNSGYRIPVVNGPCPLVLENRGYCKTTGLDCKWLEVFDENTGARQ
jgi:hypothetical protein